MPKLNDAITLENHITPLTLNLRQRERERESRWRKRGLTDNTGSRKSGCLYLLNWKKGKLYVHICAIEKVSWERNKKRTFP